MSEEAQLASKDAWACLPSTVPKTAVDAFKYINSVTEPTADDLKLMVYLEAYGFEAYSALAKLAPSVEVRRLLEASASDEMVHAHRIVAALTLLSGKAFAVPSASENPYITAFNFHLSRESLQQRAVSEANGGRLYKTWASNTDQTDIAVIFLQNSGEEERHAERMLEAADMLVD